MYIRHVMIPLACIRPVPLSLRRSSESGKSAAQVRVHRRCKFAQLRPSSMLWIDVVLFAGLP